MQGFEQAMREYEAKIADPFGKENSNYDDDDGIDYVEEMLLKERENELENYLWG